MAFDDEGNMFVVMREQGQIAGIVKINEAENTVEVVFIRVLYNNSDAANNQFAPNDITYDAAHNRFIIATEALNTFEHFYTLDKNPSGGWDFHTRKMTLANREGLPATATNAPYFFDESGSVSAAGGGKHNLTINGNYMYGHINTYFFKADLETFEAEILTTVTNTIRTGVTKHLAFNPKNSDELYFSAYHHVDNMGLSKFDIASTTFTHLSAAISGDGDVNGPLSGARFTRLRTIIFDKTGDNLYVISDRSVIKKVDMNTNTVSTLAGSTGVHQYLDGEGSVAKFNYCIGGCLSPGGKILYIGDVLNQRIRKIRLVQP
jgi:hypothetical protein